MHPYPRILKNETLAGYGAPVRLGSTLFCLRRIVLQVPGKETERLAAKLVHYSPPSFRRSLSLPCARLRHAHKYHCYHGEKFHHELVEST